jgi:ribosomal protein S18 acetylase RimI-like enzyme
MVSLVDPADADLEAVVAAVLPIVNRAYAAGEEGLWMPGSSRISIDDLRALAAAGDLAVARRSGEIVGCVRVGAGELGLLAVASGAAGTGVGRALVAFAEDLVRARAQRTMRLVLLVPQTGTHPFKQRLHEWYTRLGYVVVGSRPAEFEGLAVPCRLVDYEKPL